MSLCLLITTCLRIWKPLRQSRTQVSFRPHNFTDQNFTGENCQNTLYFIFCYSSDFFFLHFLLICKSAHPTIAVEVNRSVADGLPLFFFFFSSDLSMNFQKATLQIFQERKKLWIWRVNVQKYKIFFGADDQIKSCHCTAYFTLV